MRVQTLLILLLTACGSTPSTEERVQGSEPPVVEPPEEEPEVAPGPGALSRSEAVRHAELFVLGQGYTELEPPAGVSLQLESLDDPEQARELRRGTLLPRAVSASQEGSGWLVLFAYAATDARPSSDPPRGRAVRVTADRTTEMVHQDALLPEPLQPVTLTARFIRFLHNTPHCGVLHVAGVAEYDVLSVQTGSYTGARVLAAHGCPELARSQYESGSGDLTEFHAGDIHQLILAVHVPEVPGGLSLLDTAEHPDLHRYWAQTTNLQTP